MLMPGARRAALAAAALLTLAGCGSDATGPDRDRVVGTYTATELTLTTGDGVQDLLALGADITITLHADGTTSGELFVPAMGGQPALSADLAGTWTLSGTRVTFSQQADTFVRDVEFEWDNGRLVGSELFAGALIEVELTQGLI